MTLARSVGLTVGNMSRRKQLKPQQLLCPRVSGGGGDARLGSDPPPAADPCVGCRHCAELSALPDLDQHETDCSPDLDEDLPSCGPFPAGPGQTVDRRFSWTRSNVVLENLGLNPPVTPHSGTPIVSLLQQLLALQIQQVHQLQLIQQIHHQVLMCASHRAHVPETLVICTENLPPATSTDQLEALSAHLSHQLAATARLVQCFLPGPAEMSNFQRFSATEHPNQGLADGRGLRFSSESLQTISESQSGLVSHIRTKPNLSVIVEDLEALAALAQHRKCETPTLKPGLSTKDSVFKRKCRFCAKVFRSDSALQIHLRSHTGERPYKCNVCGNRFSTRGNLKVHFQRHRERYPHVQMNPCPVPEHLDNIQTTGGIPNRMSLLPVKVSARWRTSSSAPVSSGEDKSDTTAPSHQIKTEEQLRSVPSQGGLQFDAEAAIDSESTGDLTKMVDSAETSQRRTTNLNSQDVKPCFNFFSKVSTTKSGESVDVGPLACPTSLSGLISSKRFENPKIQLLSGPTDQTVSEPNECLVGHRIFSCQSSLGTRDRAHEGERPYQKGCSPPAKGNPKEQRAVPRGTTLPRVRQSCPVCHRKFTSAAVWQRHFHLRTDGQVPDVGQRCTDSDDDFKDTALHHTKSILDDNDEGFCEKKLSKSSSVYLMPHVELQHKGIKTERLEEPGEGCSQSANQQAAADQLTSTFLIPHSTQSLSPADRASLYFKTASIGEPFQMWPSSVTDLRPFGPVQDPLGWIHSLGERGAFRSALCDICGKNFSCQSALDIHVRSHTKERPFVCTTCSRAFSTKGNLKQHMLTHRVTDFPPRLLQAPSRYQASGRNGLLLPPVKTNDMSAFLTRGPLLRSSVVHPPRQKPRQHHCWTCAKSFSSSSALQIHERTHTGERPFACSVCGRAFTTKGNLKVHMGTHMWTGTAGGRGRRLSVDGSSSGSRTRPARVSEPPRRNPVFVSGDSFSADVKTMKSEGSSLRSGHVGLKDETPGLHRGL